MKRFIAFLCMAMIFLSVSVSVLAGNIPAGAQKIRNAKVLSDMFVFNENDIDKIEVIYPGNGDPYGCYVDKDEFFDIAKTITLIPYRRIEKIDNNNGVLIVAVDKNNERTCVWLDKKGRVGCSQYEASSAVTTQYDISRADYIKLYAFLPEEATAHIPLENPVKKYLLIAVGVTIFIFTVSFMIRVLIKRLFVNSWGKIKWN